MSVRYLLTPSAQGDVRNALLKRFGARRTQEILEAHLEEIASIRRGMWAEGRAADPNFTLSSKAYDDAATGDWLVLVDVDGSTTVRRERAK
jgi:hypothetical protein